MSLGNILVVDDDRNLVDLLRIRLESADYEVAVAFNEEEALETAKAQVFDLALVDLQLVRKDGITLMEELHLLLPEMPVIILTAFGSIENAVEAMKRGAYTYATKPFESRDLLLQIEQAIRGSKSTSEIENLKDLLQERYDSPEIVARSEAMQKILEVIPRIAKTESTVFVYGENGTGKEVIARAVHFASDRNTKSFVVVNCAAIPESLLESILFGHEKGAFTGAVRTAKGLFAQAHEGTIFLDEIGDMPISIQAKVLRVLQERHFYPVGSEKIVEVDVRVIVATNKDLKELVKQGAFREDLFYRVHVIPITLPPLRERKDDIPPLVEHFLNKLRQKTQKDVRGLTPQAMQKLMLHHWPGNVRELENTMEYAVAMTQTNLITDDLIFHGGAAPQESLKPFKETKDAFEKSYLSHLLGISEGNVTRAARLAGKYRADFYNLLRKHQLDPADFRKSE